jgi:hypothetical protein
MLNLTESWVFQAIPDSSLVFWGLGSLQSASPIEALPFLGVYDLQTLLDPPDLKPQKTAFD